MSQPETRDPAWAYAHCESLVRAGDPDRWYASLYAPAEMRPHLHALARLQPGGGAGAGGGVEPDAGRAAPAMVARRPPGRGAGRRAGAPGCRRPRRYAGEGAAAAPAPRRSRRCPGLRPLRRPDADDERPRRLLRRDRLLPDPPRQPDPGERLRARRSAASGHAGGRLRGDMPPAGLPWHARSGQVYLPADVHKAHGVTREDIVAGRGGPGLLGACADMRALVRRHLAAYAAERRASPRWRPRPSCRSLPRQEPISRRWNGRATTRCERERGAELAPDLAAVWAARSTD